MQSFSDKANPPTRFKMASNLRSTVDSEIPESTRRLRILGHCARCVAFLEKCHDAWSCDLLPAADHSNRHIQCDVREILNDEWDFLIVAHPPCTRRCNSGVRWLHKAPPDKTLDQMWKELHDGAELFSDMWNAPIPYICVENPVMHSHAKKLIRTMPSFPRAFSRGN
jgi:hypothetical protein